MALSRHSTGIQRKTNHLVIRAKSRRCRGSPRGSVYSWICSLCKSFFSSTLKLCSSRKNERVVLMFQSHTGGPGCPSQDHHLLAELGNLSVGHDCLFLHEGTKQALSLNAVKAGSCLRGRSRHSSLYPIPCRAHYPSHCWYNQPVLELSCAGDSIPNFGLPPPQNKDAPSAPRQRPAGRAETQAVPIPHL